MMLVTGTVVELTPGYGYAEDEKKQRHVFVAGAAVSCFKFSQLRLGMQVTFQLSGREITELQKVTG
jgi:cold shock CspA family protein